MIVITAIEDKLWGQELALVAISGFLMFREQKRISELASFINE